MQTITNQRTKLFFDGVEAVITATIDRRLDDGLIVTQPLPFLRLDTAVTGDDGRRSRISSVAIEMHGDIPRLRLELEDECPWLPLPEPVAFTADDDFDVHVERENTRRTFTPGVSQRKARTDGTVPYAFQSRESTGEIVICDRPMFDAAMLARIAPPKQSWLKRLWRAWLAVWIVPAPVA